LPGGRADERDQGGPPVTSADAWILRRREPDGPERAELERTTIELGTIASDEALVAPLVGCWEANMLHALQRRPIDICAARGEELAVIGNTATVEVLEVGPDVTEVRPGQLAILHSAGRVDRYGYMTHALGYDSPGQMGCLATRMRLKGRQLIAIPPDSRHSVEQWAAFGIRYVTAWANWRLASRVARSFRDADSEPSLHVWGWGGGTTLAELDLARREGHVTTMLSGSDANLRTIARHGIQAVDRRAFGALSYAPDLDPDGRQAYRRAEDAFAQEVGRRTDGDGVHIFADFIGLPVWRATRRATARQGVITTAGWKHGMKLDFLRAAECIGHHQFVHTHFAPRRQAVEAVAYGERSGWMPEQPDRVYAFAELPELAADYERNATGYFPCYRIDGS
jgi:NADPH:quinone reductase-like Zn-dependent oxidoreductase